MKCFSVHLSETWVGKASAHCGLEEIYCVFGTMYKWKDFKCISPSLILVCE